jgi:hypothetical protein
MAGEHGADSPTWLETAVKVGVSLVPYAGGALEVLVGDTLERRRSRVREFGESAVGAFGDPHEFAVKLASDERLADLLLQGAVAASATALRQKRVAIGRVVAQAARDDAEVELMQLLMLALADLDAPHFSTLAKISERGSDQDAARGVAEAAPEPVIARLATNGTLQQTGTFGGGLATVGVSSFGKQLLDYVAE